MDHRNWHMNRLKDFTLEDAMEAMNDGFYCVCGNGRLAILSNDEDIV
jgi:hypothetical protein